jgi:hypothetical protein
MKQLAGELSSEVCGQLGLFIKDTTILIAVFGPQDRLSYANAAYQESYYVDPEEGLTWYEFVRRSYHHNRATIIGQGCSALI